MALKMDEIKDIREAITQLKNDGKPLENLDIVFDLILTAETTKKIWK